jgi:5-methylthioadenosine/S-adenosylhomocysteine deaminase
MTYDLLIHNGTLVTVNPDFEILENGFVAVIDRTIAAVGSSATHGLPEAKIKLDALGGIILPGLVNTHTHLPMTLFRGLADDLPLMDWLNDHIFPAEAKLINPDSAKAGALLGCAEMLLSGTTTCCDGYFHEASVAQAILESGMRGVPGQGVIDFPAPGVADPSKNIETAAAFVQQFKGVSRRLHPSIFCHSPYTCSRETLIKAKETANRLGVLFQIHLAETRSEVEQIQSEHRVSPTRYLSDLGLLDENTLLIHAVWVDDADIALIKASGASISVNTQSNMKLASGIAPVMKFLEAFIPVGLGTDGCASNNDLDLFREMDMTAKLHKVHHMDPTVLDAKSVLKMATVSGAKTLGLAHEIGSIEPGKQADIIIVDTRKPHLTPLYHPESHLVYAASGSDVRHVFVAGRRVVKDYQLTTLDLDEVMDSARRAVNGEQ